jgi:hypothetical protein
MRVAIDETDRRRAVQEAYNREHGIEPATIVKGIRDINDRLRSVAEGPGAYGAGEGHELSRLTREQVEKLVGQLEAEMRNAARNLEFERAATLRDEAQGIRLRVLEEDASVVVAKAAEAAGARGGRSSRLGGRGVSEAEAQAVRVTSVEVLRAGEEPMDSLEPVAPDAGTAADWLPGIRDEDDGGWQAKWLDRPTWDVRVTPNVVKRSGTRPRRRR